MDTKVAGKGTTDRHGFSRIFFGRREENHEWTGMDTNGQGISWGLASIFLHSKFNVRRWTFNVRIFLHFFLSFPPTLSVPRNRTSAETPVGRLHRNAATVRPAGRANSPHSPPATFPARFQAVPRGFPDARAHPETEDDGR